MNDSKTGPRKRVEFNSVGGEDGQMYVWVKGWDLPEMDLHRYWATDELGLDHPTDDIVVKETYLAKLQTAESKAEGWLYEMRSYKEPGRGRFKATAFMLPSNRFDVDGVEIAI